MKRILLTLAAVLGLTASASAQLTPAPFVLQAYYDGNGDPYASAGICVYQAGTSTLASSYTTAAGSVANANPLMLSSGGRPSSNGFFLTPGSSYKLVLVDYTGVVTPTCSAINGVTVWTQDNIQAVPGSSAVVDVTGTAGESIAAGDVVFVSDGSNSLSAGQFYRTDADLLYRSTATTLVGVAPSAITSGATGTVRITGAVTVLGPLTPGLPYYASATIGAMTATPPTNAIRIGTADSSTTLIVAYTDAPVGPRGPPCGRLTLTTGVPVTTADVTAAGTLYYAPYGGCTTASTFDGTNWKEANFTQLSIAVPAVANQVYDVFLYDNAGALALELTAWTNDTTRATALTTQNAVYVKTGALTRLYLGTVRTVTASQLNDSATLRHVWNYYNRVPRNLLRIEPETTPWAYTTATYRQANANTANQVAVVVGVAEVQINLIVTALAGGNANSVNISTAVGEDSTTVVATGFVGGAMFAPGAGAYGASFSGWLVKAPAVGYHYYAWLEKSQALGITSWYGTITGYGGFGLSGWIEG